MQPGEKVLIHAAAGSTGQAAVQIARWLGAEMFATVRSLEKKKLMQEHYSVSEDHIFNSRDLSLAEGVMRMTRGEGVDVVLNSLSGQALFASFECLAPWRRFLEIGKGDILSKASLPMHSFLNNVSFHCIDLSQLAEQRPTLLECVNRRIMSLFRDETLHVSHPMTVFPASQVEQALRLMQTGKSIGKLVIEK